MPADSTSLSVPDLQRRVAELAAELRQRTSDHEEALRREAAVAEILQVTNASGGDLAQVLGAILEKATFLCSASYGYIWTYDGETVHPVAVHGDERFKEWLLQSGPLQPGPNSPLGRALSSRRTVHVLDATEEETYRSEARFRDQMDRAEIRTMLHVPLRKQDRLLGVITVYRRERDAFTDQQIRLLESFAEQAVIAMENARLLDEQREALERQTATAEVLQVINASPGNLAPVFDAILEKAHNLCDAPCGSLQLYDGSMFRAVADRGLPETLVMLLRQGVIARQFREPDRDPVQVDMVEAYAESPDDPVLRAVVQDAGLRTVLFVPLHKEGVYLGRIVASRRDVRPFTDKQVALLQNFAAQAVIAMDNARLLDEQREALEQQTATAEVLQVINSSPGDLAAVFDAMLEKAMQLCGAIFGDLRTYDGERFYPVAARGVPDAYVEYYRGHGVSYGPGTGPARILAGERVVHIPNLIDTEAYRRADPDRRALVDLGRARASLLVPLLKDSEVAGFIMIYRQEARAFSDKQIKLLQNFAAQAVIAMENARLLGELRQRTDDLTESLEYQTATSELLEVISRSTSDIQPVLDTMLASAARLCGVQQGDVSIRRGDSFRCAASIGASADELAWLAARRLLPDRTTTAGRALLERQVVQTFDQSQDGELVHPDTVRRARTVLAVPLMREGEPAGVITLVRDRVEAFDERQVGLIRTFADQAVIAMENARLLGELRESLDQQTATTEVLAVINSSPGDLTPVFESMLEKAHALCRVEYGSLQLYDGTMFRAVAVHNLPETLAARLREGYVPGPAFQRLIEGADFDHTPDVADIDDPIARTVVDAGIRTLLRVALRKDGRLLGQIVAARREVQPFADKEIALLQSFASQAVIAMENARLLGELRESLDQQTATSDVLSTISRSSVDLNTVLNTLVETVARLCRADQAYMFRRQEDLHHLVASHGASDETKDYMLANPFTPDRGNTSGRVLMERRTVHIPDVLADPDYTYSEGQKIAGFRTMLGIPLMREDAIIGVFVASRTHVDPFTDKEIALASGFADQAVIAIENARLFEELTDRQAELRVTFDHMGDGVVMFDADLRLASWNRNFQELLDVPDSFLASHPGLEDYVRLLVQRGELGDRDPDKEVARYRDRATRQWSAERTRPDGRVLEVRNNPVPGGGAVLIYSDITKRKQAETEIRAARDAAEAALERQTATAEVLEVINSSPGELKPVFEAMLKKALHLCEATFGIFWTYDGAHFHASAMLGVPQAFADFATKGPHEAGRDNAHGRALRGEAVIHVQDASVTDAYQSGDPLRRALVDLGGARTALGIALRKDDVLLGLLILYRQEVRPFGDKQIALLQNFAAQAVIAMENARLINEQREALEQQTATAEILTVISQSPTDVGPVLSAVAKAALKFCGASDALVSLRDGNELFYAAHEGTLGALTGERRMLTRHTAPGRAMIDGEVVQIMDLQSVEGDEFPEGREIGARLGFRSAIAAPLLRDDVAIGAISLRRPEAGKFEPRQVELLKTFAAQAVIAIENVRLFTELRDSLERLKAAQANLIQSEKMASLGQLTAGIAHEIKNPLNFVNNFAGLSVELLDELKQAAAPVLAGMNEDARAEFGETVDLITANLEKIAEHGKRADGIVKSMLAHSRGGTGDWQASNINALVEEALNLAYHGTRAQDKDFNVTLERDFAETTPIEVVPQDVTRVFLNLFGNGFYAAKKRQLSGTGSDYRPTLTVSTRDLGEVVEIRVRDNGTGMAPEVREKLFQPFFTTKPTGEGTGLGLSISYDIVTQQHGGSIEVESEPGSFTEFTVRLPRRRRVA